MTPRRRSSEARSTAAPSAAGNTVDPHRLAHASDAELADVFRKASTLPLEIFPNEGGHRLDLAARTIFNDEH
jgi:hypothetical protein